MSAYDCLQINHGMTVGELRQQISRYLDSARLSVETPPHVRIAVELAPESLPIDNEMLNVGLR